VKIEKIMDSNPQNFDTVEKECCGSCVNSDKTNHHHEHHHHGNCNNKHEHTHQSEHHHEHIEAEK
jgi:hypothetical protein